MMKTTANESSKIIKRVLFTANSVEEGRRSMQVALKTVNPAIIMISSINVSHAHFYSSKEYDVDTSVKPITRLMTTIT